jgi:dTMP kinase
MIKNPYPGKFIVLEGIDGAGCETQVKLLFDYLKKQGKSVKRLYYPDYRGPIGRLIHQYLHKQYEFPVDVQFLLYFADFIKDREKINQWIGEDKIIISDRYFTSTLAYQCLKGFPLKEALKIAKIFKLLKPDLIIYLKISPDTSIQRKLKEKKKLDRHESNKKFLNNLTIFYQNLIKNRILGEWMIVNGERSIDKISKEIIKIVIKKLTK